MPLGNGQIEPLEYGGVIGTLGELTGGTEATEEPGGIEPPE